MPADFADQISPETKPPLVVDMDGTLCRTDTLHEGLLGLLVTRPLAFLASFPAVMKGKAALKDHVARHHIVDPATLPYDPAVLELIRTARDEGRQVELVSASDHRQVAAVASHLGLFDAVIGTGDAPGGNLRGSAKADLLIARHGEKGFDYVGDSTPDLEVWPHARRAYVVSRGAGLIPKIRATGAEPELIGPRQSTFRALIKAMRPHQWAKNALIFVPALAAHEPAALWPSLLAFIAFSLLASGVYLINDLVDLPSDRAHPRKRRRPFAAGTLGAATGLAAAAGLFLISVAISALFLPAAFLGVLIGYLIATFAYSLWLKRKMMVDIAGLAGLYTLRIMAGAAATAIVVSPWLLILSMFIFTSLATLKRQAELEDNLRSGRRTVVRGRNLQPEDLNVLQSISVAAGQISVLVLALYVNSPEVQLAYHWPGILLLLCPIQFVWLSRMQILTRRGFMNDDPLVFALRDRVSLGCAVLGFIIAMIAIKGGTT